MPSRTLPFRSTKTRADLIAGWSYSRVTWGCTIRPNGQRFYVDGALISQEERDKAAKSGAAMPDGSYPITTCDGENSVESAVKAVGRGNADHDAIRRHIMKRADSLGCKSMIPDNWNDDGSLADEEEDAKSKRTRALADGTSADGGSVGDGKTDRADMPDDSEPPSPSDAKVTAGIAKLKADLAELTAAQSADPDGDDDPNDQAVAADLAELSTLIDQLAEHQADDVAGAAPADDKDETGNDDSNADADSDMGRRRGRALATAPAEGKPPKEKSKPNSSPVDDNGNVDPTIECADPNCAHLASSHEDTSTGDNSGPCTMENCECEAMKVDTSTVADDGSGDDSGGGPDNAGGDDTPAGATSVRGRTALADVVPVVPPVGGGSASTGGTADLNAPPETPVGQNLGQAFTIPVGVILGQDTGDGRSIMRDALDWREPPMPLMGLATSTHDPTGMDMNAPAVICGVIEDIAYASGEGETQVLVLHGHYLSNEQGAYFADLNEQMGRVGVSADIAVEDSSQSIDGIDDDGWPTSVTETVTKGTVMGFTVCPFPAFEGCYIVLGDGTDGGPAAIEQTTETEAPDAVAASAARRAFRAPVHFMTYEDCGCYDSVIVASGAPVRPPKSWFENPNYGFGSTQQRDANDDPRLLPIGKGFFGAPLRADEDGHVEGHLAFWNVCHAGRPGCLLAPKSKTGYAHFLRGQHLLTAEGDEVRVGVLTLDTSHAPLSYGASRTLAHYDDTGTVVAMGMVGEDAYGIWFSGTIAPDATETQVQKLRSTSPSGDWRDGEMHACLMVPVPGFAAAVTASGAHSAMVGYSAEVAARLAADERALVAAGPPQSSADDTLRALAPLLPLAGKMARERIAAGLV